MKKLNTLIVAIILSATSVTAQEKVEAITIGNGLIRTQDSRDIIGRFYKNDAGDTITIDLKEMIPVKKAIPKISQKLGVPKDKTIILKVVEPNNTIVYQELNILAPNVKPPKDTINSPLTLGYSIGRHTDQFNVRLRYNKSFNLDFHLGTSVYRGDLNSHFLFIGLSNEFRSMFGTEWDGVFSAGGLGGVYYENEEMTLGPVGIISIQREYTSKTLFGPKLIFGVHNEVGFAISTRF
jgi:hypothetical protein